MLLLVMVASLFILIAIRVPIAVAMLVPALFYLADQDLSYTLAVQQITGGIDSFTLLAVPLFILVGLAANASGITERLFDFALALVGHVRGALGYVNVLLSMLFSWMNGAALADAAAMASIEVPQMVKNGYRKRFALGLTASSALIGPLMPPSIPAVVYAVTAGVSVGGMFAAGVGPAFLLTAVLCLQVFVMSRVHSGRPLPRASARKLGAVSLRAMPPLATPVLIIGGILGGVFTPTEAAGAAVVYVMILGVLYRTLPAATVWKLMVDTARITASIMVLIGSAALFGWVLAREQAPQLITEAILDITDNALVFLLLINVVLFAVGMFMEGTAAILILVPVLQPVLIEFGIDPLHFGVVMLLNLFIGLVTPPVGILLFIVGKATGESVSEVFRGVLPFLGPLVATLLVVTYVPEVVLAIPELFGFAG